MADLIEQPGRSTCQLPQRAQVQTKARTQTQPGRIEELAERPYKSRPYMEAQQGSLLVRGGWLRSLAQIGALQAVSASRR